jgi:hypothetical protein
MRWRSRLNEGLTCSLSNFSRHRLSSDTSRTSRYLLTAASTLAHMRNMVGLSELSDMAEMNGFEEGVER